jgi:dipeptidyl aminopeptidase/acylaminoacyl peptidase
MALLNAKTLTMKRLTLYLLLANSTLVLYSQSQKDTFGNIETKQKVTIDSAAIEDWFVLGNPATKEIEISNNGNYFAYEIIYPYRHTSTLFIESAEKKLRLHFDNATAGHFTHNSEHYIFNVDDSLYILSLKERKLLYVCDAASWKQPRNNTGSWIAYLKKNIPTLVLRNLSTGNERHYNPVKNYVFDESGQWLAFNLNNKSSELKLLNLKSNNELSYRHVKSYQMAETGNTILVQTENRVGDACTLGLSWVKLPSGEAHNIFTGENINILGSSLDASGKQLVFSVQEEDKPATTSIWYYRDGMPRAVKKVTSNSPGIHADLYIHGVPTFSSNNEYILFSLQEPQHNEKPFPDGVMVDIWSHRDTILQATQLSHLFDAPASYQAITGTDTGNVTQLSSKYIKVKVLSGHFALIQRDVAGDRFWEKNYDKDSIWLISLRNGLKTYLSTNSRFFRFSPDEKYLIYFDEETGNYFSNDLATGQLYNITSKVPEYLGDENEYCEPVRSATNYRTGIAGWLEGGKGLLIYDNYDIWQIDIMGKYPPVNVTNGYGRLHKIKLRLTGGNNKEILRPDDTLLITAFNTRTKYNGFFQKKLGEKGDPKLLSMGPYAIDQNGNGFLPLNPENFNLGMSPVKAKQAEVWIVKRESSDEAPNFYLTKDFKSYRALTRLQPHKGYKWCTSELISFKQLDGKISQGILYKPEDFDSTRKYPVLLTYYEQLSHRLFQFPMADYTESGFINIPWFVSRDYLVFTPDIHFTVGKDPISAFNCVVGAAEHLRRFSYVDEKKMGISGHSRAGGFTNYILTHTSIFSAVFEGAGVSNLISSVFQLTGAPTDNVSRLIDRDEEGKRSLWENPGLWLAQTSILNADKVTSPLLIFHSKNDWAVPWLQAVEMFIALRRLDKQVWMLQYDEEGHLLTNSRNRKDLTTRVTQFFDHYLKGAPPPKWMTSGIPARLKGKEYGYEPDLEGACGTSCRVCSNKNYK